MDPLELLSGKTEESRFLSKYFNPMILGGLAFGSMCAVNWGTRRPLLSGTSVSVVM